MPQVSYPLQQKGILDLASLQMKQQQTRQLKQQQMMANLGSIIETIGKYQSEKKQKQNLKDLGILVEEPETKTLKVGTPEWGKYADQQMKRGVVVTPASGDITIPTGKTRERYDYTKLSQLPAGLELNLPGLGKYETPKTSDFWSSLFANLNTEQLGQTSSPMSTAGVNKKPVTKEETGYPDPAKYAEGSILKADGKPVAKKVRGKWQPIR